MKNDGLPKHWKEEARSLLGFYTSLLTKVEIEASRNQMFEEKAADSGSDRLAAMLRKKKSTDLKVIEALQDGYEIFLKRMMLRVYRDHPDKLNRCPKCCALCRTPKACLCARCHHTWYETRITQPAAPDNGDKSPSLS